MGNASLQLAMTKYKSLVYESSDGASNTELLCSRELYIQTWTPCLGEELSCKQETGNTEERHAVAVI